ncbi:MAG: carboxypeptidase-like regulatory domain-containing protein, partial [Paludibacteraceae bacterium]|nr:carboxypeptidase-like regulatory domain-containing protein [Paludibacteraceae bacterium]
MKRFIFCLILVFFSSLLLAQDMLIIGKVLDKKDASPIQSANIFIKGTKRGTSSNQDGFFLLRLPEVEECTLVVSVIGYKRKEIKLESVLDQWVDCLLDEESLFLDEIVIFPGENPAHALMKRVRENKFRNAPQNHMISSVVNKKSDF